MDTQNHIPLSYYGSRSWGFVLDRAFGCPATVSCHCTGQKRDRVARGMTSVLTATMNKTLVLAAFFETFYNILYNHV